MGIKKSVNIKINVDSIGCHWRVLILNVTGFKIISKDVGERMESSVKSTVTSL